MQWRYRATLVSAPSPCTALRCASLHFALAAGARRAETRRGSGRSPPERPGASPATPKPDDDSASTTASRGQRFACSVALSHRAVPEMRAPRLVRQSRGVPLRFLPVMGVGVPQSEGAGPILWGCAAPFRISAGRRGRCRCWAGVGGRLCVVARTAHPKQAMAAVSTNVPAGPAETLAGLERDLADLDQRIEALDRKRRMLADDRRRLWDRIRYRRRQR